MRAIAPARSLAVAAPRARTQLYTVVCETEENRALLSGADLLSALEEVGAHLGEHHDHETRVVPER